MSDTYVTLVRTSLCLPTAVAHREPLPHRALARFVRAHKGRQLAENDQLSAGRMCEHTLRLRWPHHVWGDRAHAASAARCAQASSEADRLRGRFYTLLVDGQQGPATDAALAEITLALRVQHRVLAQEQVSARIAGSCWIPLWLARGWL